MKRLLLFLLLFAVLAAASAPAESYRVLTYNVGLLRVFGSDYVPLVAARAAAAPAELARFVTQNAPQIILLEEVWEGPFVQGIVKELTPLGYSSASPNVRSILGLSSGLILFVKSPLMIVDWKFTRFARTTFIDSFARKGVLEATLQNTETGARFVLIGTHTVAVDTNKGVPKDKGQVEAIMSQAAQILTALASRSENGAVPALVLGDFNVGPGYADDIYLKIAGGARLTESGAALLTDGPIVTWDPENPLVKYGRYPEEPAAKIDHIFFQNGPTGTWTAREMQVVFKDPVAGLTITPSKGAAPVPAPLSDHYGFMADLDLTR